MHLTILFRQKVFVLLLMLVITPVPGADEAALTNEDILRLMQAGLGSELIIARIRSGPTDFDLSVEQLVGLKEAGIADSVIAAMMGIETDAPTEAEEPPEDEESFIVTFPAPETSPESPADPDSAAAEADAHTAARPSQEEQVEELMAQADDGELPITTLPGFEELMTCADKPPGRWCWKELANHSGCYVWDVVTSIKTKVTWSGKCPGGIAQGEGTLSTQDRLGISTHTGQLKGGKKHGRWVIRSDEGSLDEGPYVDGKRHGQWVIRFAEGGVWAGPYVDGEQHGKWVERSANGVVYEGSYVDGKHHGQWIVRHPDGTISEGQFANIYKRRHGQWIVRHPDGTVSKLTYVNGSLQ